MLSWSLFTKVLGCSCVCLFCTLQGASPTGLPVKVVDCILSLKAYQEWQQAGGHGPWKLVGPLKHPFPCKVSGKSSPGAAQAANNANAEVHSTWAADGPREVVNDLCNHFGKSGSQRVSNGQFPHEELENGWSSFGMWYWIF